MAVVFTDSFTGSDGASWAADWSTAVSNGSATIQGNAGALSVNDVSGASAKAMLTAPTALQDMDLTLSYQWSANTARAYLDFWVRGSGGWRGNYGPRDGIGFELYSDSATGYLQHSVAGTTTNLLTMTSLQTVTTAKQWLRFRVVGTTVSVKVWLDGVSEPSAWSYTYTDSTTFADGLPTIAVNRAGTNSGVKTVTIDDLVLTDATDTPVTVSGVGTLTVGTGASVPPIPAGAQANDIMVLLCESSNAAIVNDSSLQAAGWVPFTSSPQGTGTGTAATRLTSYWKRHSGTESNPNLGDSGDHTGGTIIAFRGCPTGTVPVAVDAGGVAATASTAVSCPTITTPVDLCLVVSVVAWSTDTASARASGWTNSNVLRLTEILDGGSTAGNGGGLSIAISSKVSAGSVGATTATLATSSVQGLLQFALIADGMAPSTTTVGTNVGALWNVRAVATKTRSALWNTRATVARTRALLWNIRGKATRTRSVLWNTRGKATRTRSTLWNVRTAVARTRSTLWNAREAVSRARSVLWGTRATARSSRSLLWNTRTRATRTRSVLWNTRGKATTTVSVSWRTLHTTSAATVSTTWTVRSRTGKAVAVSWGVVGPVLSTTSTLWNTRARVTRTRSVLWNTRHTASSYGTAIVWRVRARVTRTRSTLWTVRAHASRTRSVLWNAAAHVSSNRSTLWRVRVHASRTRSVLWNDAAHTSTFTRSVRWNVRTKASRTRSVLWNAHAHVTCPLTVTWAVEAPPGVVGSMLGTSWHVRAHAAQSSAVRWNTRHLTGTKAVRVVYDLRARAARTRSVRWNTHRLAPKSVATFWGVRLGVTSRRSTTWNVTANVSREVTTTWDVVGRATTTLAIRWNAWVTTGTAVVSTSWSTRASASRSVTVVWATAGATFTGEFTGHLVDNRVTGAALDNGLTGRVVSGQALVGKVV